jgi:ubiquinone/menaquinone biosynthesis C-methylase UbiE
MIGLARKLNADRTNCVFAENESPDLPGFASSSIDFVYSSITLQHLPRRPLVHAYLSGLIRVLAADGLLAFQLPFKLSVRNTLQPKSRAYALLRRAGLGEELLYFRFGLNPMRAIGVPAREVSRWINGAGGRVAHAERVADPNPSYRYYVQKR